MKNTTYLLSFIFIILFASICFAQYNLDTLISKQVADGVHYYNLAERNKPWDIHILQADLTNPNIKIKSAKATNRITGNRWVTDISTNNSFDLHNVVGGY
jgi:hypothetical protein